MCTHVQPCTTTRRQVVSHNTPLVSPTLSSRPPKIQSGVWDSAVSSPTYGAWDQAHRQEIKWGVFFVKMWQMGVFFFVKKWTFLQRSVHYVQYHNFNFTFYLFGGAYTHNAPPCLRACWGGAPAKIGFWCILALKYDIIIVTTIVLACGISITVQRLNFFDPPCTCCV